jgi:hypothetical protein
MERDSEVVYHTLSAASRARSHKECYAWSWHGRDVGSHCARTWRPLGRGWLAEETRWGNGLTATASADQPELATIAIGGCHEHPRWVEHTVCARKHDAQECRSSAKQERRQSAQPRYASIAARTVDATVER